MHFLVDPIVLCLPSETATSDEISYFIQHLIDWNEFITINQGDDEFCITETCYRALYNAGRYPLQDSMKKLINRSDSFMNANDIYNACRQIIESACWPSFEEKVELPGLLVDCDEMILAPNVVERIPSEIAGSLQETLGYVAYAKEIVKHDIALDLYFLTYPLNNSNKIEIAVTVEDAKQNGYNKHKVETDLPIVESPEDLRKYKSLKDIWKDTEQAIEWAKGKMNINTGVSHYIVGPEFNQSLENCQFPTHFNRLERCFQKIAQLLTNEKIRGNYELRTGEGANDPQITEIVGDSTWSAWRLRITEGRGAVYRLHYWKNEGKYVFSHVVDKDEYNICTIDENIVSQIN